MSRGLDYRQAGWILMRRSGRRPDILPGEVNPQAGRPSDTAVLQGFSASIPSAIPARY